MRGGKADAGRADCARRHCFDANRRHWQRAAPCATHVCVLSTGHRVVARRCAGSRGVHDASGPLTRARVRYRFPNDFWTRFDDST